MKRCQVILAALFLTLHGMVSLSAQPIGVTFTVGETSRFRQGRTSTGKMIVRQFPETHFVWTERNQEVSQVFYNIFVEREGVQYPVSVSDRRSSYPNICRNPDDSPWVFFTGALPNEIPNRTIGCAANLWDNGQQPPNYPDFFAEDSSGVFPFTGCINRSQTIFGAALNFDQDGHYYPLLTWRATPTEYPFEYSVDAPRTADESFLSSYIVAASDESDAASLVWHHYRPGFPPVEWWNGYIYNYMENDINVVESRDGSEWSFDAPLNITQTIDPDPEADFPFNLGDTLRPYPDLDAIYVEDVLHVVFTTCGFVPDIVGEEVYPRVTFRESLIWHWDSESDTITLVANGWYPNAGRPGSWLLNVCKPSIGADEENNLYCIFRQVTEDDTSFGEPGEQGAYCFGEIMLTRSTDGGITWTEALNITGTHFYNGEIGDLVNETYPSLAENVDDYLHIQYLQYGATSDDPYDDREAIQSPIIYHRIAIADIPDLNPLLMPREGFTYHIQIPAGITEIDPIPHSFGISEVYPNPFNQSTRISFDVERSGQISLELFNLQAQRLEVIVSDNFAAGRHSIIWNAGNIAGGVYIIRLNGSENQDYRKIILLK